MISTLAEDLKKIPEIKAPEWSEFVKTGRAKDRIPDQKDWWYQRSASILKKVERLGPVGVQKLRIQYGSKKNRGYKPEKFFKGSGKIIRVILQQLEKAELIKEVKDGVHKGRKLTPKGQSLLSKSEKNGKK